MTVQRIHGGAAFSCDSCPETYEPEDPGTFDDDWSAARALGWRTYNEGGRWQHRCPDCARSDRYA